MPVLTEYRLPRRRKIRIGETARGYSQMRGPALGFPVNRGTANGAEMKPDFDARIGYARENCHLAVRLDGSPIKECADSERAPGPPLALPAMT